MSNIDEHIEKKKEKKFNIYEKKKKNIKKKYCGQSF